MATLTAFNGRIRFSGFADNASFVSGTLADFLDQNGQYVASNIAVGDVVWDNQGRRYIVAAITSSTATQAVVDLTRDVSGSYIPSGVGFVCRDNSYGMSIIPAANSRGISSKLLSKVNMHNNSTVRWIQAYGPQSNNWHGVTYGNGLFVSVSNDGANQVKTSPDGINWTARNASSASQWLDVTYANGLFVAVGNSVAMSSTDGITWTARTPAENNQWYGVVYGNGLFVAVASSGTNRVMTSPDGVTWTSRSASEANNWTSVTYGNGLFVAVASSGTNRVMSSPDGITWTARSASEANTWNSVTYGNGLFVAVASSGTNRVMSSPDGITWTARSAPEANGWNSIAYGNGIFLAVALSGNNRSMYSLDGITWTAVSTSSGSTWYNIGYGDGRFVAVSIFSNSVMVYGSKHKNEVPQPVNRIFKQTTTLNFPSTNAGTTSDLTITVPCEIGDAVHIGPPHASVTGGLYFAWVSAANTVTVRFFNPTASPIDPASGDFTVVVTKK